MTIIFLGQTFKAHRLVLAACSNHFETLFNQSTGAVNPALHNQLFVILDGTRADDLQILLQFMYRGEAYLHQDRINSVLRTAEVLQVKGLSEGPKNLELNEKNMGSGATPSTSGGGSSASNARTGWTSPPHESSPLRSTVGIMGNMRPLTKREHHHRDPHAVPRSSSDLHSRDLVDGSPPHHLTRGRDTHHRALSPPPPDHGNFVYPPPRSGDNFGPYGTAFRGIPPFSRDYSPSSNRDRSPPPPDRARSYGSASTIPVTKEERDAEMYEGPHRGGSSRSGSLGHTHHDRGTPVSEKGSDRHTPASHHGGGSGADRDYEMRSSRNSPPSPVVTPNSLGRTTPASERAFPSDSTTDFNRQAASSSSTFKDRIRRNSDTVPPTLATAGDPETTTTLTDRSKYTTFQNRDTEIGRSRSPRGNHH